MGKKPFNVVTKKIKDPQSGVEKTFKVPVLSELPVPVLNKMYKKLHRWATAGSELQLAPGALGNLQLGLLTPRSIERRESTGAIRKARIATEGYSRRAQQRSLQFWNDDKEGWGFHRMVNAISGLKRWGETRTSIPQMHYLNQWYPTGRIVIDKETGLVSQYADWVPTGEYYEDGNPIYEWRKIEPLMNGEAGYQDQQLIIDPHPASPGERSALDVFLKLHDQFQAHYNKAGKSWQNDMDMMNVRYERIAPKLKDLPEEYVEILASQFHNEFNIGGFNTLELQSAGTYSPVSFSPVKLPFMYDRVREQLTNKIETLNTTLGGAKLNEAERTSLQSQIWETEFSLTHVEMTRDLIDEMHDDPETQQKLLSRHYVKNFKPISGMFDWREKTTGPNVVYDYMQAVGKQLERNAVTLDVLEALVKAESDGARDYIINLYKTTFQFPDAAATFLGIIPIDMVTVSGFFNKVGIPVSVQNSTQTLRAIGAYASANLLWGPETGLRNGTAMINKIHEGGLEKLVDALDTLDGPEGDEWRFRVERVGVSNFTEYFEGWTERHLRPEERALAKEAIKDVKLLIKDSKENPGKHEALYKRYKKRLKKLRLDYHLYSRMDRWMQWAVTHNIKEVDPNASFAEQARQRKAIAYLYKKVPSIQGTEGFVRSLSYIIGNKGAVEAGLASHYDDPIAEEYGIEYAYLSDHGLSPQDLGLEFRGALGNLNTKLKYWSVQRMGTDYRTVTDGWEASGDFTYDNDGKKMTTSRLKKTYRMIDALFMVPGGRKAKALREANPQLAAWRSLTLIQGTATMVFEMLLTAPGATVGVRYLRGMFFKMPTLKASTGLRSDLFSMVYLISNLVISLGMTAMGKGRMDREDYDDRFFIRMLRNMHTGLLPNTIVGLVVALFRNYDSQPKEYRDSWDGKQGPNAITPLIPGGNYGRYAIEQLLLNKK